VTAVSCASSLSKRKIGKMRKENQYKIRKIKEKKNKIVSVQASHNMYYLLATSVHMFSSIIIITSLLDIMVKTKHWN